MNAVLLNRRDHARYLRGALSAAIGARLALVTHVAYTAPLRRCTGELNMGNPVPAIVPLPGALLMFGGALSGLWWRARRRCVVH